MPIKVLLDTISYEDIQKVLDYYNQNKPLDNEPLLRLNRYEGGFKINISDMKDAICDANLKIKQLRWHRGFLVSQYYIGFNDDESELLYKSLVNVLGENNVILS